MFLLLFNTISIVFTVVILLCFQYWSAWNNYNTALSYLVTVPKYRMRAKEIAESEKLIEKDKKKLKGKSKVRLKSKFVGTSCLFEFFTFQFISYILLYSSYRYSIFHFEFVKF